MIALLWLLSSPSLSRDLVLRDLHHISKLIVLASIDDIGTVQVAELVVMSKNFNFLRNKTLKFIIVTLYDQMPHSAKI